MAEETRDRNPPSDVLAEIMAKLDEVMAEAERLRGEVSRQLASDRADQQQRVTAPSKKQKTRKKSR